MISFASENQSQNLSALGTGAGTYSKIRNYKVCSIPIRYLATFFVHELERTVPMMHACTPKGSLKLEG